MVQQIIPIFLALFILIDPLGVSMIYLSLTAEMPLAKRRKIALRAPLIAFIVLGLFIFLGQTIIGALGIMPGSLYVAGGILLFFVATDLLFAKPKRTKTSEQEEDSPGQDMAIFPLALPLLSGPGAITAILLYLSDNPHNLVFSLVLLGVVAVVLGLGVIFMLGSRFVRKVLRDTGVKVIERIMGILLAGMSVQFVYNGLVKLEILPL